MINICWLISGVSTSHLQELKTLRAQKPEVPPQGVCVCVCVCVRACVYTLQTLYIVQCVLVFIQCVLVFIQWALVCIQFVLVCAQCVQWVPYPVYSEQWQLLVWKRPILHIYTHWYPVYTHQCVYSTQCTHTSVCIVSDGNDMCEETNLAHLCRMCSLTIECVLLLLL